MINKKFNCLKGIERDEQAASNVKQYELIGLNEGIAKGNESDVRYTTYLKKPWNADQRLVQPDILITSSLDVNTLEDFNQNLLDETSTGYAQQKQRLLDIFLEEYTLVMVVKIKINRKKRHQKPCSAKKICEPRFSKIN